MGAEYNTHFESLFQYFMGQLQTVLPPSTDIVAAYSAGTDDEQAFVQDLALFFTSFFRVRLLPWAVMWNSTARQARQGCSVEGGGTACANTAGHGDHELWACRRTSPFWKLRRKTGRCCWPGCSISRTYLSWTTKRCALMSHEALPPAVCRPQAFTEEEVLHGAVASGHLQTVAHWKLVAPVVD